MKHAKELSASIEAALAGGRILKSYYGSDFRISFKGALNLVTQADTEAEEQVLSILRKRLPEVSILAEESGASDGDDARRFFVDPLDGTTNFAHGYPMFAVAIGYEEAGTMKAAVVFDPIREELFTATRGGGAFLNGRRLSVTRCSKLDHALLATGFPYDRHEDVDQALRFFRAFMQRARAVRRDGSAALDLCYLAAGRFDGFWEEKLGPWDTAAGSLMVEEAGGRVTDLAGESFHCTKPGICASNGGIHEVMLDLLASVG